MEVSFLQFFAATAYRAPIHIVHGLEQSRIELNGMVRFRKREFGQRCVELQLEALEKDRVIDASFRPTPAQDAVSEDELDAFRLAINAAVERVKGFEDFHRRSGRLFGFHPLISQKLPTFQACGPNRI